MILTVTIMQAVCMEWRDPAATSLVCRLTIWRARRTRADSMGCCLGNTLTVGHLWPGLDRLVRWKVNSVTLTLFFSSTSVLKSGSWIFSYSNARKRTETSTTYARPTSALRCSSFCKDTQRLCFGQRYLSLYVQMGKISVPGLNKFLHKWSWVVID